MVRSVFRKPSLKKSLSARYKGAYKRKIKKALIPGYGTRTAGWLHPKRKLYNKMYYRTSIDTRKMFTGKAPRSKTTSSRKGSASNTSFNPKEYNRIDTSYFPTDEQLNKHPKAKEWFWKLLGWHRACYHIWRVAVVLFFVTATLGWQWAYTLCFYIWAVAVILRLILPIIINTLCAIVQASKNE